MIDSIADKKPSTQDLPPESVREQIKTTYDAIKSSMPEFRDRFQQRKMIAEVAATLNGQKTDKKILVVEGPTGTGKTLAYLLAAIPLAQYYEKKLVIASATVALQEQLIFQDLPLIQKLSKFEFNVQIAKGRGRYACISKMQNLSAGSSQAELDISVALWDEPPKQHEVASINKAFNLFKDGKWNGDLDLLPIAFNKKLWPKISNTFHSCTANRCQDYKRCAFFIERRKVASADVIIANHDLVLTDIASGGTVLPPMASSFYVFDEAHRLPAKAISHFTGHAQVLGAADWLSKIDKVFNSTAATGAMKKIRQQVTKLANQLAEDMHNLHQIFTTLSFDKELEKKEHIRFLFGVPPKEILEFGETRLWQTLKTLRKKLDIALELARKNFDQNDANQALKEQQISSLGFTFGRVENLYNLWLIMLDSDKKGSPPFARWLTKTETGDFGLHVSPISAAEHLAENLWDKTTGTILTSATLTALNSFARFNERSGLNEDNAEYLRLPSPFDLSRVALNISTMTQSPKNHLEHTRALIKLTPDLLAKAKGTLFLFSSRRQMEDVYEGLSLKVKSQITIQGDDSKQEILKKHKDRIKENLTSAIFGLDSFAEGMDLPGKLCEHVIIAKLPFAVPTSPIEEASAEFVESRGKNYFFTISVPDASIKLIQACGRLMRNESDKGEITILDNRLLTTGYGKVLLKSLPEYKRPDLN